MAIQLPLIGLYAYSVKKKAERQQAAANQKALADSAVHNWVRGPNGMRKIPQGGTLNEGETLYGFSVGRDTKIQQFKEKYIDMFENPLNPEGPLMSRLDFENYNKQNSGIDLTTSSISPGKSVGQKNPIDNKVSFYKGYERFKKKPDVEKTIQVVGRKVQGVFVEKKPSDTWVATHGQTQIKSKTKSSFSVPYLLEEKDTQKIKIPEYGYMNAQNMFVPIGKDSQSFEDGVTQRATHSRVVTKIGDKVIEYTVPQPYSAPRKASEIQATVRYLDKNGLPTDSANAVKFEKVKVIDGNVEVVEEAKSINKLANQTIVTLYDKDGKVTYNENEAVMQKQDEFDGSGVLIKEGLRQKYDKPKASIVPKSTEYIVKMKGTDGKIKTGLHTDLDLTESEVLSGVSKNGEEIIAMKTRNYNKDNIAGKWEPFDNAAKAKSVNTASSDLKIYGSITLKTDEPDGNFGKKSKTLSMNKELKGIRNLVELNSNLLNSGSSNFIEQINNDPALYQITSTNLINEMREHYRVVSVGAGGMTIYKNLPRTPQQAIDDAKILFGVGGNGLTKLKDFDKLIKFAAEKAGAEEKAKFLASSANLPGESAFVAESTVESGTFKGQTGFVKINYPSVYENEITNILPQYVTNPKKADAVIQALIKSKLDEKGNMEFKTLPNGTKVRVLDDRQELLAYIKDMNSKKLLGTTVIGADGKERPATYLDAFFSILHPYPKEAKIKPSIISGDVRKNILEGFVQIASNDFNEARRLIEGFTDVAPSEVDNLIRGLHGNDLTVVKVQEEIRGKSTSAFNAMITIDSMLDTYQIVGPDGVLQDININTVQGGLIVKVSGAYETASRVFRFFKGESAMNIVTSSVEEINNNLVDQDQVYDKRVNPNDPKEIAARAKNQAELARIKKMMAGDFGDSGFGVSAFGIGEGSKFVQSMPPSMQKAYRSGKLGKEIIRKLAIRQYHKYMLAYQLAAAIQGGTGGRTISDQDVQNILQSLNFGTFTEASLERATLLEAKKMMTAIYDYNNALLSKDTTKQYSAIKARQLLQEGGKSAFLGIGNLDSNKGVLARRKFIMNSLKIIDKPDANSTDKKIDKDELKESQELDKMLKQNKR
tara:strand:+ start:296 stop:3610 length:3315 start_codon:yes stop_codon:yes gene_type:complete